MREKNRSKPDIKFLKTLGLYSFVASMSLGLGSVSVPYPAYGDAFFSGPSVASGETPPESFESYQMRILRNQNQLQAEKIQSMRSELVEINQKLNELKPHLFKHGDPENEAKIAELNHQLAEKERALNDLITTKAYLQMELEATLKKMREMETVKEALTSMIEAQRQAKEQNLASFMKQLEDLQSTAERHKTELFNKILAHESHTEKLTQQVADKDQTIRRLDTLATQLNKMLANKDKELWLFKDQILSLHEEHALMADNHADELNQQKQKTEALQQHWQDWQDAFLGNHAWLLDELHALQASLDKEKSKYLQELDAHTQTIEEVQYTFENHIQDLLKDLEKERAMNEQFARLQSDHLEQKKDLDDLHNAYASLQEEMYGHLQQLTSSLSQERKNAKQIENELITLFQHHEAGQTESTVLKNEHQRLLEELSQQKSTEAALLQNTEHLMQDIALKERIGQLALFSERIWLASDELEIRHIRQDLADLYEILTGYVQDLDASLLDEKTINAHLSTLMAEYVAITKNETHQKLAQQLATLENQHQRIQNRLENEKIRLEQTLVKLNQEIENKSQHHANIERELGYLTDLYQYAHNRHIDLDQKAADLSNELQEKNQAISERNNQAELLSQELQEKNLTIPELERKAELLSQELQGKEQAITELKIKADLISQESELLFQELQEKNLTIPDLERHAEFLSQELQEKDQAITELQIKADLLSQESKFLSQELQEKNQAISELENKHEILSQELQGKDQAISELVNKHEILSQELQGKDQAISEHENKHEILFQELQGKDQAISEHENKHEILFQELQGKDQAISEHENKHEILFQELHGKDQAITELERKAELLYQELQEKDQAITELRIKADLLSQESKLLSQELQGKDHAIPELERKTDYLSHELHQRTQALLQLEENSSLLLQDLEKRNERLSLLESKLSTLDFHNRSLSDDNQELLTQKNQLLSQVQTTEHEISTLAGQIKQLQNQLVKTELLLADMESIHASNQRQHPSENSQEHAQTLRNLQSELASASEQNNTLEKDLNFMRTNYIRERNSTQNLEAILSEVTQELSQQKKIVKEQLSQINDKNKHSIAHSKDTYSADLAQQEKKDEEPPSEDLKKQCEDLQHQTTDLSIQLNNLSLILKDKEKAQMQAEQRTLKIMNKNKELSDEIEHLKNQMNNTRNR